jgi:hypothetical protein
LEDDVKKKHAEIHFDSRKWMKLVQDYIHGRLEYTQAVSWVKSR